MTDLHTDELGPAALLRRIVQQCKLPGTHAARPDVANLPALNQVVESLHNLLGWSLRIEAMDLQEVDVVGAETLQRRVDSVEDCSTAESVLVYVVTCKLQIGTKLEMR